MMLDRDAWGDALSRSLVHHLMREEEGGAWQLDAHGSVPLYALTGSTEVSPSALELARRHGLRPDPSACASFLCNGVFSAGAIHGRIQALPPGARVTRTPSGLQVSAPDEDELWREVAPPTPAMLVDALQQAVAPLRGHRVICDLTGGLDSRLVALSLKAAGIDFTATVTGAPGSPDPEIAGRLARRLGVRLIHDRSEAEDAVEVWRSALEAAGGCVPPRQAARLLKLQENRREFEVSVGGLGGELYRDFWWLQDPIGLGENCEPDWQRLVASRLYQNPVPTRLLRGDWAEALRGEPARRAAAMAARTAAEQRLRRKRDRLDFAYLRLHLRFWAGASIATSLSRIRLHNPLLHPEALRLAFSATEPQRRLGRWVREAITVLDRGAAALPVESGGSALPLSPWRPWRRLPLYGHLVRGAARRLPGRRPRGAVWGERPLPLDALTARGIIDAAAVQAHRHQPGSLAHLERLVGLELLFGLTDAS